MKFYTELLGFRKTAEVFMEGEWIAATSSRIDSVRSWVSPAKTLYRFSDGYIA